MDTGQKVELIPWEPLSEQHFQRMYDQRIACGWRETEVGRWKEKQLAGIKQMYWIVLADDLLGRDQLVEAHLAAYPRESEPLVETATGRIFNPVGHTALEHVTPEEFAAMDLPPSTLWVRGLYISWALQRSGIGRSAMAVTEQTAATAPFFAAVTALDTVHAEFQLGEAMMRMVYDYAGMKRPDNAKSNYEWFISQGYRVIEGPGIFEWKDRKTGELVSAPLVFMKKSLMKPGQECPGKCTETGVLGYAWTPKNLFSSS